MFKHSQVKVLQSLLYWYWTNLHCVDLPKFYKSISIEYARLLLITYTISGAVNNIQEIILKNIKVKMSDSDLLQALII